MNLKKNQSVSVLLILVMLVNFLTVEVAAIKSPKLNNDNNEAFIYEDASKQIIKDYDGDVGSLTIPDGVEIIRRGAFKDKGIEELTLNKDLRIIEAEAFSNNKIKAIKINNNIEVIGERAFADNTISKLDLSEINNALIIKEAAFQDNKISGRLDLSQYKNIVPKKAFWNNKIESIVLNNKIAKIEDEAFAVNKLTKVQIPENTDIGSNVFASNGQFVEVNTSNKNINSEKATIYNYGHIKNPVNIIVRSLEPVIKDGVKTGKYKKIIEDKAVKFDPRNPDNAFALNDTSFYKAPSIIQYEIKNKNVEDDIIKFIPNKDDFILDIYYEKIPNPTIVVDQYAVDDIIKLKKEGDNITEEELLRLVYALDYKQQDISKNIKVNPKELINVEAKEYEIIYTVVDGNGLSAEKRLSIPISIDPMKIPVGKTDWVLGDFTYYGNEVTGLTEQGKNKAQITGGIAVPHINPLTMEPITKIGFNGLADSITEGPLFIPNPDLIESIAHSAFENSPIIGELPQMPNLVRIDSNAFANTKITGHLKGFNKLESIGYSSFENSGLDGEIGNLPSLKRIESLAFKGTNIKKLPNELPLLEKIDDSAFQDISSLSGEFPITPNLKSIAYGAFQGTSISGEIRNFDNLEILGDSAFQNTQISGSLPALPKLKELRSSSLANTNINGPLPDLPEVIYIGQTPFSGVTTLKGSSLPKMPKVEIIEYGAFSMLELEGEFEEIYPNLKTMGVMAFYGNNITGKLPQMPQIEEIQDWVFNGLDITGEMGEMPNLRVLGTSAFYGTKISGEFPKAPNLERLGDTIFTGSNLEIKDPIILNNNNITIEERAFEELKNTEYPIVLITKDGKDAPGVNESTYHVLNPQNVNFVGVTKDGEVLIEKRILAKKDGDNIVFELPRIMGYKSDTTLSIKESDLDENGLFEYEYERIINNDNDYEFQYTSDQNEGFYAGNEVINTSIKFNTINSPEIKKGIIDVYYDEFIFNDFYVPQVKSVDKVEYNNGYVRIILSENIIPGTDMEIPVSFKIKEGTIPETLFDVEAELNDLAEKDNRLKGHGKLSFGAIYVDPIYKSEYYTKEDEFRIGETVKDLDEDYSVFTELYPKTEQFIRKFNKVVFEYDAIEFEVKDGKKDIAKIAEDNGWVFKDNKYIYELNKNIPGDLSEANIPPLKLQFDNPATTLKFIEIDSRIKADVDTKLEDFKYFEMDYKNYLFIHVAEEGPYSIGKAISVPHYEHPQYSYFYDNVRERDSEFVWRLYYSTGQNIDKVILTDYNLDSRMMYTGINLKDVKALINLYDEKEERLLTKSASEYFEIPQDIQNKVSKIELIYDAENKPIDLSPEVITKLRNQDIKQFNSTDKEKNDYWNEYKVDVDFSDGRKMSSVDRAKTTVKADNKNLATLVEVNTKTENLTYGKTANTDFYIKSKEFIDMDVREMKYTALINKGQIVEDVVIPDELKGSYVIKENYNGEGLTRIDFVFTDINVQLKNYKDKQKLFSVKTTPEDKKSLTLNPQGFLHKSDDYIIYQTGDKMIADIDAKEFSYDKDLKKIINGSYFTLYKKIVDENGKASNSISSKPGDQFYYRFEIDNATEDDRIDLDIIDILPFNGDNNKSEYRNILDLSKINDMKLPKGFEILFLNQEQDIDVDNNTIIKELSKERWETTASENTKAVRIKADVIEPQSEALYIDIPMITNESITVYDNGKENHNVFAFKYKGMTAEQSISNKVTQKIDIEVPIQDIKLKKISTFKGLQDGVLRNVEFILRDENRNFIASERTDDNGELIFKNIKSGDYTIEEFQDFPGYKDDLVKINIKLEDMLNNKGPVYDIGNIINERLEEYPVVIKDVEYTGDINELNYKELKDVYNRNIKSGEFEIYNESNDLIKIIKIVDRNGLSTILPVGKYTIKERVAPRDNGMNYEENHEEYQFEIDKFGNLLIGDKSLINKEIQNKRVVYFPHKVNPSFSNINIKKVDLDKNPLEGAKFQLTNSLNGDKLVASSDKDGLLSFNKVPSGLYILEEIEAPAGYLLSNDKEIIDVPLYEDKEFDFEFINKKLKLNIHKYKIVRSNLTSEEADRMIDELKSPTGGKFIKKELIKGVFEVREVWKDNDISISTGKEDIVLKTNEHGSIFSAEQSMKNTINPNDIIKVDNKTEIPGHYQELSVNAAVSDYQRNPDFDGTIDIDLIVKPLEGSIFVSRYVLDKDTKEPIKGDDINGSRYTLYVDKGNGYELLEEKEITNGDFVAFTKLNPTYKYKVVESFIPEGQKESVVKEQLVELNDANRFTEAVIFRNYKADKVGSFSIQKIDGNTGKPLAGAEFALTNKFGESEVFITNNEGRIEFEELALEEADYILEEVRSPNGYRLNHDKLTIREEDLIEGVNLEIKNFKTSSAPETGTLGKLPYILMSALLLIASFILKKKKI